MRLKAKVAWKTKEAIGLKFARLTEIQQKDLEEFLRATQK